MLSVKELPNLIKPVTCFVTDILASVTNNTIIGREGDDMIKYICRGQLKYLHHFCKRGYNDVLFHFVSE